jgi:predicted CXXCH cytochrome family protein
MSTKKHSRKQKRPTSSRRAHRRTSRSTSPFLKYALVVMGFGLFLTASGFTFAANQEQRDSFCSSCHTQPESTFYQRSTDAQVVDLASMHKAKNVRCIDCHSGTGVTGRISAELLGAHNALAWYTGTAVQPAKQTVPIGDGNCIKCHQDVVAQQATRNNHFHVFLARWQLVDPNAGTCVSCHGGHTTDGTAQTRFMNDATTRAVCDSCHQVLAEGG